MRRRAFDTVMSAAGAVIACLLLVAGALLIWAHSFIDTNVHSQLAAQQIEFPAKGSPALTADPEIATFVTPYAGQRVTNGAQAEVFADHFIAVHLREIGHGKTYSQVSAQFLAMRPTDAGYQQLSQTRQTLFMGETLRGLLLNAYAFWKMGQIALWAAIASFAGAGLMLLLSALGFRHGRHVAPEAAVFVGGHVPAPRRGAVDGQLAETSRT